MANEIEDEREAWLQENKEAISAKIDRGLAQLDRGEGISGDELRTRFAAYRAAYLKARAHSTKDR
jgi:predicted transcriptional regulator